MAIINRVPVQSEQPREWASLEVQHRYPLALVGVYSISNTGEELLYLIDQQSNYTLLYPGEMRDYGGIPHPIRVELSSYYGIGQVSVIRERGGTLVSSVPESTPSRECSHQWITTQGFSSAYTDCSQCGAKQEDIPR